MKKSHLLGVVCAMSIIGTANTSLFEITATSLELNITDSSLQFDGLLLF